jgi:hypothetical protein
MIIEPKTLAARGSLVDLTEVNILLNLLEDSSTNVRLNTLETLTHLPLPEEGWAQLVKLIRQELQEARSFEDRAALLEIGTWVPYIFDPENEVGRIEADSELRKELLDAVNKRTQYHYTIGEATFDRDWAATQAPGFVLFSESELLTRKSKLQSKVSETVSKLSNWWNNESLPDIAIEDPVLITLLFEFAAKEGSYEVGLINTLLQYLQKFEDFRPDLNGLFEEYLQCVMHWSSFYGKPLGPWFLLERDDEDGYSWRSWQIAWTVSRGGLKGLIPALEIHLTANDETRQIAALGLIADSADYTPQRHAYAALFGGGIRPPRLDPTVYYSHTRMLTAAHPRRLSKGQASTFLVLIHPNRLLEVAIQRSEDLLKDEAENGQGIETHPYSLDVAGTDLAVLIKLSSDDIRFDPEKAVAVRLPKPGNIRTISFGAKPKEACLPGNKLVRVSVTAKDTEEEILSKTFRVRVDDYAFDHVSRPFFTKSVTFATAVASAASVVLGLLEQIDTTTGLAAGTAFFAVAGATGFVNHILYNRPSTKDQVS